MTPKQFDLSGKVAIVTGGHGGIGLGMARGLADAGADIAVVGRNEAKSAAAVDGGDQLLGEVDRLGVRGARLLGVGAGQRLARGTQARFGRGASIPSIAGRWANTSRACTSPARRSR